MEFDSIIVHYDEIGLKGNNRGSFERLLIDNIKLKSKELIESIKSDTGQITISLPEKTNENQLKDILSKIPGIAYFSFAKKCSLEPEDMKKESLNIIKDLKFETFKIESCRHDKMFKLTSMQLNVLLGDAVLEKHDKKVKLKNPDLTLKVDLAKSGAYLSHEDIQSVGGLPTNNQQNIVALLSGGFDSPVASYLMMKRGCNVILVHFQNKNQMTTAVEGKIIDLAEQLSKFQTQTTLYIVPFDQLQKEIIMKAKAPTRMLIYRRFMLRISSKIADLHEAKFLVVGDCVSQVASQTLENLNSTYEVSDKPIFSPLIGLNKKEIIKISQEIGTYEISAQPYGDCCSYFLPKHPILKSNPKMLEEIESTFETDELVNQAIKSAEIKTFE
jgi:tRNA uracil 4-sulfurtransferase